MICLCISIIESLYYKTQQTNDYLQLGFLQITELPERGSSSTSIACHIVLLGATWRWIESPLLAQFLGSFVLKAICNVLTQDWEKLESTIMSVS